MCRIPCDGCPKVHLGQTGQTLKHWLVEALKNGDVIASALTEHPLATGHSVDLTTADMTDHHSHTIHSRSLLVYFPMSLLDG